MASRSTLQEIKGILQAKGKWYKIETQILRKYGRVLKIMNSSYIETFLPS